MHSSIVSGSSVVRLLVFSTTTKKEDEGMMYPYGGQEAFAVQQQAYWPSQPEAYGYGPQQVGGFYQQPSVFYPPQQPASFPQQQPGVIPMSDPVLEPEAYEAWKAVREHVAGGADAKVTGRPMKEPPRKFCTEFQLDMCLRGSGCRFLHEYDPDALKRAKEKYDRGDLKPREHKTRPKRSVSPERARPWVDPRDRSPRDRSRSRGRSRRRDRGRHDDRRDDRRDDDRRPSEHPSEHRSRRRRPRDDDRYDYEFDDPRRKHKKHRSHHRHHHHRSQENKDRR